MTTEGKRRRGTGVRGLYRETVRRENKNGTVHEEERYRFDLRWREPTTGEQRRFKERFAAGLTLAAAKTRAQKMVNAAMEGGWNPRQETPKTLGEALDEYEKWAETNKPRSAAGRKSLSRSLRRSLGNAVNDPLDDLSPFAIERMKRDRRAEGAAPGTVNREVAMLKHMLKLAADGKLGEGVLISQARAAELRKVELLEEPPGRVRELTDDEDARLLAALSPGIRPIVEAALLSGMRRNEVALLRKSAVNLAAREITLTRTKNNTLRPAVPVNAALAVILRVAMDKSPGEYVFTSRTGKPYTPSAVSHMFHRAVVKAGITDLRFHDCRHDFATRARRNGAGLDAIGAMLGHAPNDLACTMRYAHIGSKTLRDLVDGIERPTSSPVAPPLPHTAPAAIVKAANG